MMQTWPRCGSTLCEKYVILAVNRCDTLGRCSFEQADVRNISLHPFFDIPHEYLQFISVALTAGCENVIEWMGVLFLGFRLVQLWGCLPGFVVKRQEREEFNRVPAFVLSTASNGPERSE